MTVSTLQNGSAIQPGVKNQFENDHVIPTTVQSPVWHLDKNENTPSSIK